MRTPSPLAVALVACMSAQPAAAQCAEWSAQFAGPGSGGPFWALQEFGGELYGGGQFEWVAEVPAAHVARFDGMRWRAVGEGLNDKPRALAVFDDGTGLALYASGDFTLAEGMPAARIARWDGLCWSPLTGSSGEGLSGPGYALEVFDDGSGPSLWVAGSFDAAGGIATDKVARWDGSEWHGGYAPALQAGAAVEHALAFDDGSGPALYVSGAALVGGVQRWDGAAWSAVGAGTHEGALVAFDDGGGEALFAAGTLIDRWDGSGWTTVADPEGGAVQDALVWEGRLHVAGGFDSISGVPADRVARWDGLAWTPLDGLPASVVRALASYDAGGSERLFAAGQRSTAGGEGVVAVHESGTWEVLDGGGSDLPDPVRALAAFDPGGGTLLFAGEERFTAAPGQLAGWNGSAWVDHPGPTGPVDALAVLDDGSGARIYAGGRFLSAGGVAASRVASWDGAAWSALDDGVSGRVEALAGHDPGTGARLYVGGGFQDASGVAANFVASWDGARWAALGGGTDGRVRALLAFDDGAGPSLFVGGDFTTAGGAPAAHVARWDGSAWHALGGGFDARVKAFAGFDDGAGTRLYAGGEFSLADGAPAANVAVWDGSAWSEVGGGIGEVVNAFAVLDLGSGPRLAAFGRFGSAHVLESGDWLPIPDRPDENVYAALAFDDGVNGPRIHLGGEFQSAGGYPNQHVAAWGPGCGCVESYCVAGTTTSGCVPALQGFGQASLSEQDGFRLTAAGVEGQKTGLIYFGLAPKMTLWAPASTSFVCVAGPVVRTGLQGSGGTAGSCDGEYTLDFNAWVAAHPTKAPPAGSFVHAQAWFRDAPAPKAANFSDALRFVVCP